MKARIQLLYLVFFVLGELLSRGQSTAITYQGRLVDGGAAATGTYDFTFTLFATNSGGSPATETLTNNATAVSSGLFTVSLDFGQGAFTGADRWLEIAVRTNGTPTEYTILLPRQLLSPAPYAIAAGTLAGVIPNAAVVGIDSNTVAFVNPSDSFQGAFAGNGGGITNVNALTLNGLTSSNFVAAKNGVVVTNLTVLAVGSSPATNPRMVLTNDYTPNELWFTSDGNVDRSAILFGRMIFNGNGANFLWNPTHDDPNGTFGGEMQISAPQIAFGMGSDSSQGAYHPGRRMQLGIGAGHLQWIDIHYDDNAQTDTYPGWTLPVRWQIEQGPTGSHTSLPTIFGYSEDLIGGTGHTSLGFYDYFDVTAVNQGTYSTFAGATSTLRGRMKTGRGWDFYGSIGITNIVNPANGSNLLAWNGTAWSAAGVASTQQNGSAPVGITFPVSGVNWTNPLPVNIQVYIDNAGVTGTAINKNGARIFSALSPDVVINLQPGESFSETYTAGTPSAKYSPF